MSGQILGWIIFCLCAIGLLTVVVWIRWLVNEDELSRRHRKHRRRIEREERKGQQP